MVAPRVLVILVNWNRALDSCACLESLAALMTERVVIALCENGSSDDSESFIRDYLQKRYLERERDCIEGSRVFEYESKRLGTERGNQVVVVLSPSNLGFAGGNNLAYRAAMDSVDADFVWFLNNDTEVEPDCLQRMIERMDEDPFIGICGATLVYAHDRKTVQAFGGAEYQPMSGGVREIGQGKAWPCSVNRDDVERRMSYVSGASMLVRSSFLEKVGLMTEDYFLYYEEIDWAERARRAGFKLGYASNAVVFHKEGAALGSGKSSQRSALAEYYGVRNRLLLTRRFFPWALPTVFLFSWAQVGKRLLQGHWRRARMMAAVLLGLRRSAPGSR